MITVTWLGYYISVSVWTLLACALVPLYFAPSIVALTRRHHNAVAIAALNILLGWTVVGWVGAFVWSLTAKRA